MTDRPLAVAGTLGVLYAVGVLGLLYAAGQVLWPPPDAWFAAISAAGAGGALVCGASFVLGRHPMALRWAAFCGLLAGGWTCFPGVEPTAATVFQTFLPLALRQAVGLRSRSEWLVGTLVCGAAIPFAPHPCALVVIAAAVWTVGELIAARRLLTRAWWTRPLVACIVLPVGMAVSSAAGLRHFELGMTAVVGCALALVIFASIASAKTALDNPGASQS